MWFIAALAGNFLLGMVAVLDKFILTKSIGKPVVYTFYSTVFTLFILFLVPFGVNSLHGWDWVIALFSGASFSFALLTLYTALKKGEASHILPFNGAVFSFTLSLLSFFLLGEKLTYLQISGIVLLIVAAVGSSLEKTRKAHGFHTGFLWAALSGVLFALNWFANKYLYLQYDFFSTFVWVQAMCGVASLLFLFSRTLRSSLKHSFFQKKKSSIKVSKHKMPLVIGNKLAGIVASVLLGYAISAGSVALVGAMNGIQYAFMFVIIYVSTRLTPRLFKEYFTRRELALEVISLLLIVIGTAFLVL